MMLLIVCSLSIAGCAKKAPPNAIDYSRSVQCRPTLERPCASVTPGFIDEHAALFDEVIRLRAALTACQKK